MEREIKLTEKQVEEIERLHNQLQTAKVAFYEAAEMLKTAKIEFLDYTKKNFPEVKHPAHFDGEAKVIKY